jgi:hypothetical protein
MWMIMVLTITDEEGRIVFSHASPADHRDPIVPSGEKAVRCIEVLQEAIAILSTSDEK